MIKKFWIAEWTILKALWNKKPQTMKEIIASIQKDNPNLMWQYKNLSFLSAYYGGERLNRIRRKKPKR